MKRCLPHPSSRSVARESLAVLLVIPLIGVDNCMAGEVRRRERKRKAMPEAPRPVLVLFVSLSPWEALLFGPHLDAAAGHLRNEGNALQSLLKESESSGLFYFRSHAMCAEAPIRRHL